MNAQNPPRPQYQGHNIHWCDICGVFGISCETCKNSTCNGAGCPSCEALFKEWHRDKKEVTANLNAADFPETEERKILREVFGVQEDD